MTEAMVAQFCAPASWPATEGVFAVQGDGSDGAFDGVVVAFDATVFEEEDQPVPVFGDIFQGFSGRRFA